MLLSFKRMFLILLFFLDIKFFKIDINSIISKKIELVYLKKSYLMYNEGLLYYVYLL